MDRDLIGFDEASDPGQHLSVNETNWEGHEARVPPARKGPRQAWTPAPVASRASVNPPTARVAIPIAPPDDRGSVPSARSFRTPAPVASRSEHPVEDRPAGSSSTLLLVGAGLGAATAAVLGSVGVVAVVVAVLFVAGTPSGGLEAEPTAVAPVVVTAAPGAPSRAVVSRTSEVAPAGAASQGTADSSAPAASAAAPQGWVESTVRAVSSLVSPSASRGAAPQPVAPRPVPHVEQVTGSPAAAAAVNLSDYGMGAPAAPPSASPSASAAAVSSAGAAVPTADGASRTASGELSVAGQVLVDRPGSSTFSAPVDPAYAAPVAAAAPMVASAPASAPVAPSGWSNVVDTVTSLVTGAPVAEPAAVPFSGPALVEPVAAPLDDMDDLLSALSTDRPVAPVAGAGPDPMAALLADLEVQRPAPAPSMAPPAAAPASGGWYDTVVGVGSAVASLVAGGEPVDATFAAPAAVPVQVGGQGLVADDDEVLRASRTSGWEGEASVDESTRAILAELDEPLPSRAGQPTQQAARVVPAREVEAPAAAAFEPDDSMASLVAGLGDERAPAGEAPAAPTYAAAAAPAAPTYAPAAAQAAAPAAAPASGGWFDTVVGVGSSVASMMQGDDGLFAPTDAVPAAGPGLALDDEEVVRGRTLSGWETAASADDPTTAVLAELDGPMPPAGRPTMSATAPAPTAGGLDQDATAALMASLDEEPAAPASSGGYLDTAASWAGSMAGALLGESPAPVAGVAAAPAPAGPVRPAVTAADAFFQSASVAAAPAAPRDCAEGEWCDDDLSTWRDDGGSTNLLTEDELELGAVARTDEGELFALPSDDGGPSGDFDVLSTYIVNVTTDVAGIPVEIDGKKVGTTPLVAEVAPGMHTVQLFGGGGAVTTYRLSADRDPEEWCFEVKGRSLKNVTCR